MAWEVCITSAPRGLQAGRTGFCPVIQTQGIPATLVEQLEGISGYRHLDTTTLPSPRNPVVWMHSILRLGNDTFHVLSRICDAGRDYSSRSNRLAHHVVLRADELVPAGPAALLQSPGFMMESWDGQLRIIPRERQVPKLTAQPQHCQLWEKVWGDAGWAGVLAQTFLDNPSKTIYFIYPANVNMLDLFREVIALLPESQRWKATFSTYDQAVFEVSSRLWRAVPGHSPDVSALLLKRGVEVWDLRQRKGPAPDSSAAAAARMGRIIEPPKPVAAAPRAAPTVGQAIPLVPLSGTVTESRETRVLEVMDSKQQPPTLASGRGISTAISRKKGWNTLIVVLAIAIGLCIGLGIGFAWGSGALKPFFATYLGNSRGGASGVKQPQDGNATEEKPQQREQAAVPPKEKAPAAQAAPGSEKRADAKPQQQVQKTEQNKENKQVRTPEASKNQEGSLPAPQGDAGKASETTQPGATAEKNANQRGQPGERGPNGRPEAPAQPPVQPATGDKAGESGGVPAEPKRDETPPASAAQDQQGKTDNRPPPPGGESNRTSDAAELEAVDISQWEVASIDVVRLSPPPELPGGHTGSAVLAKKDRELFDQRKLLSALKRDELELLRVIDRAGQVRYFTILGEELQKLRDRQVEVFGKKQWRMNVQTPPGTWLHLRQINGWKGTEDPNTSNTYQYSVNNTPLVKLTISRKVVGSDVEVSLVEQKEEKVQPPQSITACLGFFVDDPAVQKTSGVQKRIWVTLVNLTIKITPNNK